MDGSVGRMVRLAFSPSMVRSHLKWSMVLI